MQFLVISAAKKYHKHHQKNNPQVAKFIVPGSELEAVRQARGTL